MCDQDLSVPAVARLASGVPVPGPLAIDPVQPRWWPVPIQYSVLRHQFVPDQPSVGVGAVGLGDDPDFVARSGAVAAEKT